MPQMQVRARTLQPGGNIVHDVFCPEDSPWRVAAEFWLCPMAGDIYFSDMGNEDDWFGFAGQVAKQPEDDFAIVEKALLFYAQRTTADRGMTARDGLAALDRLTQDWAERSANALQEARDAMRKGWD